ncbi:MAG: hypothetical protein LBK59_02730, partial [Bifidobacteriaceae bacterium]|jgi:hypothetical protein|nr:hypothetical protein [Bifidobacteriaceae bacterium]
VPEVVGKWPGPAAVVGKSELSLDRWIVGEVLGGGLLVSGLSVAHMGIWLAAFLGASSIALIGQDLAFASDADSRTSHASDTVTQAAAASASVSLSRTAWAAPSSAGSVPVTVTTNRPEWTATSNQPWLGVAEGHGVSGRTVAVEIQANPGPGSRTGVVTVTAGGGSRTLSVTQAAGPGRVTTSPTVWIAPAGGGADALSAVITGGASWTASESSSWLALSTTGAVASGGSRTLTASANTTTSRRSATVTVRSGSDSTTITVIQDTTRALAVSRTTWSPSDRGASVSASVDVYNEGIWTAISDQPWLLTGGPTGPGADGLTLVAEPNAGPARAGTVTITSGTQTVTVRVTQRAG